MTSKTKSKRAKKTKAPDNRKSKPTEADLAAAERFKRIRNALPASERPTQEQIVEAFGREISQSAISQMMNGVIAMTFEAVLVFAAAHHCRPEDIRDDLPAFKTLRTLGWTGPSDKGEKPRPGADAWPFPPSLLGRFSRLSDKQKKFVTGGLENAISLCESVGDSLDEKSDRASA